MLAGRNINIIPVPRLYCKELTIVMRMSASQSGLNFSRPIIIIVIIIFLVGMVLIFYCSGLKLKSIIKFQHKNSLGAVEDKLSE